jgi:hypothetical protein
MSNPYPHIQHLRQLINTLHQASREERIKLAAWEDDRPFSILGELEILASTIQGYVGQFTNQQLNYPTVAIADLQQRNPFAIPELAEWYSVDGENYPNLCRYLELLDYLRLSLLTIIQTNNLQAA